jgi:hypothetical protein
MGKEVCVWLMVQGECRKKAQVRELEVEIGGGYMGNFTQGTQQLAARERAQ